MESSELPLCLYLLLVAIVL